MYFADNIRKAGFIHLKLTIYNKFFEYTTCVICHLPPSYPHCRSYDKGCEPLYLAGRGPVPCTGKKCPVQPPSTKTVHPGPEWRHSLGICWIDLDMPGGKQLPLRQDWGWSPFVQPPCSTALPQTHAPSAGCLSHPTAPSAEELALHLQRSHHRHKTD